MRTSFYFLAARRPERLTARLLSELSEKIEEIGGDLFVYGALIGRSQRLAEIGASGALLFSFSLGFRGSVGVGLIRFAPCFGTFFVVEAQNEYPSRRTPPGMSIKAPAPSATGGRRRKRLRTACARHTVAAWKQKTD